MDNNYHNDRDIDHNLGTTPHHYNYHHDDDADSIYNSTHSIDALERTRTELRQQQREQYELSAMIHSDSVLSSASHYFIPPPEVPIELNDPTQARGSYTNHGSTFNQPVFQDQLFYPRILDPRFLGFCCAFLCSLTFFIVYFVVNDPHRDSDVLPAVPVIFVVMVWFNLILSLAELVSIAIICCFFPIFSQRPNNPKKNIMFPSLTSRRFDRFCIVILCLRFSILCAFFLISVIANFTISHFYTHWNWVPIISIALYTALGAYNLHNSIRGYRYGQHATRSKIPNTAVSGGSNTRLDDLHNIPDLPYGSNDWVNAFLFSFVVDEKQLTGTSSSQTVY